MKQNHWLRVALVAALAGVLGLTLIGPRTLWAQGDASRVFLALATGSQETPSVDSPGIAFGRFVLSADKKTLAYTVHVFNLKGKFTAMHLHRGKPGVPGDVVYPLGAPTDGKATGNVNFNAADETEFASQGFYLNIHTDAFPGGEIRGQVVGSPDASIGEELPQGVSFSKEIQPIFSASCGCHSGGSPPQGQNLSAGKAYANIVDVKSKESSLDRIEPGDPAKSYMIHKLNNTQRTVGGSGARMPLGGRLSQDKIDLITKWVTEGAKNN